MAKKINKKGSALDIIYIAVSLLTIAIIILIVYRVSDSLNTQFQTDDQIASLDTGSYGRNAFSQMNDHFAGVLDNSFLFLVMGLAMVAFILASLVRVHPMFFFFFLFVLIIIIFLCGAFSNIYQEMMEVSELTALADELIFIKNIMTYLPFIVGTLGTIMSVIMYKNWQNA